MKGKFLSEICQKLVYLNVASFGFYLDNINKYGKNYARPLSIYIDIITDHKERIRQRTPLKVRPKHWDVHKQTVKHAANAIEINHELAQLEKLAFSIYQKYKAKPKSIIKEQLKMAFFEEKQDKSLRGVYDAFMRERAQVLAERTIRKYNTLIGALMDYDNGLEFVDIDMHFYDGFTQFFRDRGLLDDTIAKYISDLKTFMRWAARRGYHDNYEYDHTANGNICAYFGVGCFLSRQILSGLNLPEY